MPCGVVVKCLTFSEKNGHQFNVQNYSEGFYGEEKMIYCATNNIYLCDLEFLGAEITILEEQKKGKRIVRASWAGRKTFELQVEPCPQG